MKRQNYRIPDHVKGDTFNGVQFTVTINDAVPTSPLVSVRMKLRVTPNSDAALTLASGEGITITDATNWIFSIDSQVIDVVAQTYQYDIETTDAGGNVKSYIYGQWKILDEITY